MKIAVCASGNNPDALIDARFGRAAWFGIYDDQTQEWTFVPNNQDLGAAQGAGIQAAMQIIDTGAEVLLARNIGPKAMAALATEAVKIYETPAEMTLREALAVFSDSLLTPLDDANVEGHWI